MAENGPVQSPEQFRPVNRPERRFESRRLFWLGVCGVLLACIGIPIVQGIMNPTGGMDKVMAAGPTSAPSVLDSRPPVVVASPTLSGQGIRCRAVDAIEMGGGAVVPGQSMLYVSGFTQAGGGMVEVGAAGRSRWVPSVLVLCDSDFRVLEKPYVYSVTPSPSPSATVKQAVSSGVVRVATVVVTVVAPAPVVTPEPGVYFRNGCFVVSLQGVSKIFVDGQGTSTGTYCNASSIEVVR